MSPASSTCPQCQQPTREGALFCQSCGAVLGAAQGVRPADGPARLPELSANPRAPLAGIGSKTVAAPASAPVPPAPAAAKEGGAHVVCPDCSTPNPLAMNFCKMCGAPLRLPTGTSPTMVARPAAMPSALAAVVGTAPTARASAQVRTCTQCGRQTPSAFAFCQHCGTRVGVSAPVPATLVDDESVLDTLSGSEVIVPLVKKRVPEPAGGPAAFARLVCVQRDGSEGEIHHLVDDIVDIGRSEGQLVFAGDKFLAPRHARIERRAGVAMLQALDTINGVYVRVRAGEVVALRDGDLLLLGKEVLRFDVLEPEERAQLPAVQHGLRLFGSPLRAPWGRLRQVVQAGITRDVYHLVPTEVVLGREEGDLRFPDDEFMSRRHARVTNRDGKFELVDLESSNGTYVRLRGERILMAGDLLRVGDQLFRYVPVP